MTGTEFKTKQVLEKLNIPKSTFYKRLSDLNIQPKKNDKNQIYLSEDQYNLLENAIALLEVHGLDTVQKKLNIDPAITKTETGQILVDETETGLTQDISRILLQDFDGLKKHVIESFNGLNIFVEEYAQTKELYGQYRAKFEAEQEKIEIIKRGHDRDISGLNNSLSRSEMELADLKIKLEKEQTEKEKLNQALIQEKSKSLFSRIFGW